MLRQMIFKDSGAGLALMLPVTPTSYEIDHGINVETVRLNDLGDTHLPGKRYMMSIRLDCLFPARRYGFLTPGAVIDPYYYVRQFETWCDAGTVLRFLITGTNVNTTCVIGSIRFREQDGTNDIYATIDVKQYRVLTATGKADNATGNLPRESEESKAAEQNYKVKSGDTLSAICRKQYGDAALYGKLATYNGVKNPNLIYTGATLKLPDKGALK